MLRRVFKFLDIKAFARIGWLLGNGAVMGTRRYSRSAAAIERRSGADSRYCHVVSMYTLFREERTVTDPKFCEGFEILLVSTSNCVFLPTLNAETTLSRRVWLDLYNKRGIHERRSMDPNESVRLQFFCHPRD